MLSAACDPEIDVTKAQPVAPGRKISHDAPLPCDSVHATYTMINAIFKQCYIVAISMFANPGRRVLWSSRASTCMRRDLSFQGQPQRPRRWSHSVRVKTHQALPFH
ncbi:hypothetical protein HBH98_179270 [Parastagonospora nodorum]|nr:hypothetical protein HBH53_044970 [Parastagonospora nodorum]KAH3980301.1 hypothetical protein HBH52_092150 [Parastagonospora nodorum]KAH4307367.1 hypothetical protein HBI01_051180 [Parastagonospora nodorum]KAH4336934.1 hypothetical protein HBI00_014780 [Parastagonospora nodorum]KAH4341515.1 hypothetical protein HBH98_179270 [Parastagonospora nodorum]